MGNNNLRMSQQKTKASIDKFTFHGLLSEEEDSTSTITTNGLFFRDLYLPEELLILILSHIDPNEILKASLVCRKWCNIIKSSLLWSTIYTRHYPNNNRHQKKKPNKKLLPWYVYYTLFTTDHFDTNLIRNGNGEMGFDSWTIIKNYGDEFKVEDPPVGSVPLPADCPDFRGHTGCFATSYYECSKMQVVSFERNRLMQLILTRYKPHVYVSEWVTGRFDCGCIYTLTCKLIKSGTCAGGDSDVADNNTLSDTDKLLLVQCKQFQVDRGANASWQKIEMVLRDYPDGVNKIAFEHEGRDTQFWKGHYGSKMAGGVLKILFDTIESIEE